MPRFGFLSSIIVFHTIDAHKSVHSELHTTLFESRPGEVNGVFNAHSEFLPLEIDILDGKAKIDGVLHHANEFGAAAKGSIFTHWGSSVENYADMSSILL